MPPERLNDFDPAHMRNLFEYYSGSVLKSVSALSGATEPARGNVVLDFIRTEAYKAALLAYGLDEPPEVIREFLARSLSACRDMFALDGTPSRNTPVALMEGVHTALVLDRLDDARQLAQTRQYPLGKYDEHKFVADEAVMGYIVALLASVRGSTPEARQAAQATLEGAARRKEGFVRQFRAQTEALLGVIEQGAGPFRDALGRVVELHAAEARRGRLREAPEGLMCVSGLALARLGTGAGLVVDVESPYLPLSLLAS
ncbi:MAG: immunity 49 family protein [Armatimonadetes bacterium]|nr:immunity 49 family protein [Armatimonadota bacterium]